MNHRTQARAIRAATRCGCGRPASHRGVCTARVTAKRKAGWRPPPKRWRKEPPALEECLLAIEALHLEAIRFAHAFEQLRLGPVTRERLLAAEPDREESLRGASRPA